eukprot:m.234526 g.234526  ORF g.234526 m.234526 type:complete len:387 (+) comp19641_c0_seq1:1792-2952(+)
MAALWSVLQTLLVVLGLIFSIVSLATESWSSITFDISNPATLCTQGALCFIVPTNIPTNQTTDFEKAVQIGIFNATNIKVDIFSITTLSQDLAEYPDGPVQLITIFLSSTTQDRITTQRVGAKVYSGQLAIVWKGESYKAAPVPVPQPLHIDIDFGLVNECFHYNLPIAEFTTPLSTRICFSKADICTMVDSKEMDSLVAQTDSKDVQADLSIVCKKMTATVALCAFGIVTLTLVAAVVAFPTIRRFSCHLASPHLQAGLLGVASAVSLCAVIVWGTVVVDAKNMEQHFADQLQKTEIGTLINAEFPRNFSSKLSYSFYLQICAMLLAVVALGLTVGGGLSNIYCLVRPFPGTRASVHSASSKQGLQALPTGDDDDEDDDRLIDTL